MFIIGDQTGNSSQSPPVSIWNMNASVEVNRVYAVVSAHRMKFCKITDYVKRITYRWGC